MSQIAVLNNDNLRLRASELSLARRLANEQDRTRRLYREAESAVSRLEPPGSLSSISYKTSVVEVAHGAGEYYEDNVWT